MKLCILLLEGGFHILHTLYVNAKERRAVQYLLFTLLFSLQKKGLVVFLFFFLFLLRTWMDKVGSQILKKK